MEVYLKQVRFRDGTKTEPDKVAHIQLNVECDNEGLDELRLLLPHVGSWLTAEFNPLQQTIDFNDEESMSV